MSLVRWKDNEVMNPFKEFERLQDEINKLFSSEYSDMQGLFEGTFSPAIDIIETGDEVIVTCDLPGVELKDIDVSVASNVLTIKGEKKDKSETKSSRLYRKETWSGSFQRTLSLPTSVDPNKVKAELKDGILNITFQKREEVKPKQISVQVH
ncbi:MAG TPA: Hsp20/alpha crystallin family protein [Spirochaetia bacterium]|jgi:HSP20 family protein|nr:Hsp20/alpha crystallin family protein [Spirochaetia bacterium]